MQRCNHNGIEMQHFLQPVAERARIEMDCSSYSIQSNGGASCHQEPSSISRSNSGVSSTEDSIICERDIRISRSSPSCTVQMEVEDSLSTNSFDDRNWHSGNTCTCIAEISSQDSQDFQDLQGPSNSDTASQRAVQNIRADCDAEIAGNSGQNITQPESEETGLPLPVIDNARSTLPYFVNTTSDYDSGDPEFRPHTTQDMNIAQELNIEMRNGFVVPPSGSAETLREITNHNRVEQDREHE